MWPSLKKLNYLYRATSSSLVESLQGRGIFINRENNPHSENNDGILVTGDFKRYANHGWFKDQKGLHLTNRSFPVFCEKVFGFPKWGKQTPRSYFDVALHELAQPQSKKQKKGNPGASSSAAPISTITIATANLAQRSGKPNQKLSESDIIALQECPRRMSPFPGFRLIKGNDLSDTEKMAFLVKNNINVVSSREIKYDFTRFGGRHRNALLITIEIGSRQLTIANVHLSGGRFDEKNQLFRFDITRNIDEVIKVSDIIAGDFNGSAVNNSYNADRLSKTYKAAKQTIQDWLDAPFNELKNSHMYGRTIVTVERFNTQVDYIFYRKFGFTETHQETVNIDSDHLALIKSLTL